MVRGDDRKSRSWVEAIDELVAEHPDMQVIIIIAPGKKNSSPIYDDVKFHTINLGIPTQFVLQETIFKNYKTLRNILKNIMIQISAKGGGQPWGLKDLPLFDKKTMVVGIDVAHKVGKQKDSVLGFAATMDRYASKYYVDTVTVTPKSMKRLNLLVFDIEALF